MSAKASAPFAYNLLELYRQHRDEVDALTDQTSLFILAFTNQIGRATLDELAGDLNLPLAALRAKLTPLVRGQMMLEDKGALVVTALGKRVLTELGFIVPPPVGPSEPPKKPEPPTQPSKSKLVRREVPKTATAAAKPAAGSGWIWGIVAFMTTGLVVVVAAIVATIILWPQPTPPPPPPIQIAFSADRTNLMSGECTTLGWQVQGAEWVEVNGQRVSSSGTSQVCPKQTTSYWLVTGGGTEASQSVTVNVWVPSPSPSSPPSPTPTGTPPPTLTSTPTKTPTRTPTPTNTRTPTPTPTPTPRILFFDDFNGPYLDSIYQPGLPNAIYRYGVPDSAAYQGASDYSFQKLDGNTIIRLRNKLGNTQRKGWSTSKGFMPESQAMRLEARFNTLYQSPETGIDQLLEMWLLDAGGPFVCSGGLQTALFTCWHYDKVALLSINYGKEHRFSADSTIANAGLDGPFGFADNTWYRMVLTGSTTQPVHAAIYADSGTKELIGVDLGHTFNTFEKNGFKIGISQSMGFPNGVYPTDVGIDWIKLSVDVRP